MKKTSKIFSIFLALAMMLSLLSVTAFAETMDNDHDRTGVAMMNGIFGEVSTEVCGVAACSGSTTETTATPTITVAGTVQTTKNGKMTTLSKMGGNSVTVNVSGSGYIYINGTAQTSASFTPTNAGTIVQVIIQNGEAAPYITWLCLKK
jgi:hypothetical protein